jgi:hypothetical protein
MKRLNLRTLNGYHGSYGYCRGLLKKSRGVGNLFANRTKFLSILPQNISCSVVLGEYLQKTFVGYCS